jgi:uncharacterized protein (DUF488 family)
MRPFLIASITQQGAYLVCHARSIVTVSRNRPAEPETPHPWRCHRSLVGDALLVRGIQVEDIMSEKSAKPHKLTAWARVDGLRIGYPEPG